MPAPEPKAPAGARLGAGGSGMGESPIDEAPVLMMLVTVPSSVAPPLQHQPTRMWRSGNLQPPHSALSPCEAWKGTCSKL